jgi:precorrin-6A/cobalt-precorrin-6A reductase
MSDEKHSAPADEAHKGARVLVFGGTGETHELASRLLGLTDSAGSPLAVTMSVASDYGRSVLPPDGERFDVLCGPMLPHEIERRLAEGRYLAVIDATHPYATHVTGSIAGAAEATGTPCLRLARDESDLEGCKLVDDADEATALLADTEGNVLLTTGVKDLDRYTGLRDFDERLYPRVLPSVESVGRCIELGYQRSRIIAMQGPFSRELNEAIIRQFHIEHLVTKDGGAAGGFPEKVAAARACGVDVIVIRRPVSETGLSMDELIERVRVLLGAADA